MGIFQEENTFVIFTIKTLALEHWVKFTKNTVDLRTSEILSLLVDFFSDYALIALNCFQIWQALQKSVSS